MIRALRQDEPIPDVPPAHYSNGSGYVRLRWHIGPDLYVEEYEHRINAGRPDPDMHVHHVNGVKDDNDPSNLQVLSARDHAIEHERQVPRQYMPYRNQRAAEQARRKHARHVQIEAMCHLYHDKGLSTVEVAELFNVDASNVCRALSYAGRPARTGKRETGPQGRSRDRVKDRAADGGDVPVCERCGDSPAAQIHHRRPRAAGGSRLADTNRPSNLIALCVSCHYKCESHRDYAHDCGWLVRQSENPPDKPMLYRHRWVLLTDSGAVIELE